MWSSLLVALLPVVAFGSTIPKRIIQTSPAGKSRADWDFYQASLRDKNPDFEFLHFDDDQALAFIEKHYGGTILHMTFLTVTPIMKADLFRLAAVLQMGGFYFDMDILGKQSLDSLVDSVLPDSDYQAVFPKEWWMDNRAFHNTFPGRELADPEDHWQVGNYAFGATPNHPFVHDVLTEVVQRSISLMKNKKEDEITDVDILATTGPYVLTDVYHRGRKQGMYGDLYHMPGDRAAPTGKRSHGGPDWHKFGSYCEHMLTHSWVKTTRYLQEYDTYGTYGTYGAAEPTSTQSTSSASAISFKIAGIVATIGSLAVSLM